MSDAQRVVNVIRDIVLDETENGALVRLLPGVVFSGGGSYECSAYVGGSEYLSESIRLLAGAYVNTGDYVVVGFLGSDSWVNQILPYSLYSRLVADWNNARLSIGNGSTEANDFGASGELLRSGGTGSVSWDTIAHADLTDYEENTWTPELTFATPGDLSVAYSVQNGSYTRKGNRILFAGNIVTSTFTHGSASGALRLTGLPYASSETVSCTAIVGGWAGSTPIQGYVQGGQSYLAFYLMNATLTGVTISEMLSGTNKTVRVMGHYKL